MDLKLKNITGVLIVLLGLVGLLGALYMVFMINGIIIGTTNQVATSGGINVSSTMASYLANTETQYIDAANSLNSNVTLALKIFAVVVILALFGLGGYFAYDKLKNKDF